MVRKKTKPTEFPEGIIVSHRNPDFDAFCAAFAAKKLFPQFQVVMSGEPGPNLQEYLTIHREHLPFFQENEVDLSKVREMVVVDTCVEGRLGPDIQKVLEHEGLKTWIYDHHPVPEGKILGQGTWQHCQVEEIGSATTILVEHIKSRNLHIDQVEATLFAIGIFEDTGNFLFSSTTTRDFRAAAFLLEQNANLDIVAAFVKVEMTVEQQNVMEALISNARVWNIHNVEIAVGVSETEKFLGGLGLITSKIWLNQGYHTFISVVRMNQKVYLVGRTASTDVNLGELMGTLRGGGHKRAAAAKLTDVSLPEVLEKLRSLLPSFVQPAMRAHHIMSRPVKTILAGMEIKAAHRFMAISGVGGIPVIEKNRLVGMVVRRDVQKAMDHDLGERPVKSIMTPRLVVADVDDSVEHVKKLMVENAVGRIPVLKNGILTGIITRTDIIREVYDEKDPEKSLFTAPLQETYPARKLMMKTLSPSIFSLLERIGKVGRDNGHRVYVVGGFVRDLLLGIKNLDIDIVVEGNAIEFARLVSRTENCKIEEHAPFLTAKLRFPDGFHLDAATARIEYYEHPGALPNVDSSNIRKDLYRRDFSINALAISLDPDSFGRLIDYFGGRRDIEQGVIRVLYNTSFIDDPTRIMRGVRYEQRYAFSIEPHTLTLLQGALEEKYLDRVSGGRLREEFERSLQEKNAVKIMMRLGDLQVFHHLFPFTFYTTVLEQKLKRFFALLGWLRKFFEPNKNLNVFYAFLFVLLEYTPLEAMAKVAENYGIPKKVVNEIHYFSRRVQIIAQILNEEMPFSDVYSVLEGTSPEAIAYLASYLEPQGQEHLKEYLRKRRKVKFAYITGRVLVREYHFAPGESIKEFMQAVSRKKMDGELVSAAEEREFIESWLEERKKG